LFAVNDCESCPEAFRFAVIEDGIRVVVPFVIRFVSVKVRLPLPAVPSAFSNV
jgi:hypothetical protein